MYKKKKLKGESYDDSVVKNKIIEFCKETFDLNLKVNEIEKRIDLLSKDDIDLGVEVERGKWKGNFWENEPYCKISGLGFPTINIPERKEKYWMEFYDWYGKIKHNPSWLKNIFIRTNFDFTQIIVIKSEVIRNPTKLYRSKFKPNNSFEIENWLSFKREDVDTYNLIDGKYIKETKVNWYIEEVSRKWWKIF